LKSSSKITIIAGIAAIVIVGIALTVHFRLSETEKSEIESGSEQHEKESASQIANEIIQSLQNKPESQENEAVEEGKSSEENENTPNTTTEPNEATGQIDISVNEVDEVYSWSGSSGDNPEITLAANMENTLQIINPTDTKHEFVITLDGEEIVASGDIEPESSGKITIIPTGTGVFEYHCEYHPDTMKGIITIQP